MCHSIYNFFSFAFLFFVTQGAAQDHGFFKQLWQKEGLSQSSISSILQDDDGFLWMSTQDGLNRYDGKRIDKFTRQPFNNKSLSGDIIETFGLAPENKLWVYTKEGIDLFDLHSLQIRHLSSIEVSDKNIYRTFVSDQTFFIFSQDGFQSIVKTKNEEYALKKYTIEHPYGTTDLFDIYTLCTDEFHAIYLGTSNGIYKCEAGSFVFKFLNISFNFIAKPAIAGTYRVYFSANHLLYFSIDANFYQFNLVNGTLNYFSTGTNKEHPIRCALADNHQYIWIGTYGNGLFRIKEQNNKLLADKHFTDATGDEYGLKSNAIEFLFQKKSPNEDIVWIGTSDAGAFSYSYSKNSIRLLSSSLKSPKQSFFATVKDKQGIIWTAIRGGIARINPDLTSTIIDLSGIIANGRYTVQGMYCDEDDTIWIGYQNGLFKIDKKNNVLIKYIDTLIQGEVMNHVFKVTGDRDQLLIASGKGLICYNKQTKTTRVIREVLIDNKPQPITNLTAIFIDSKKNWWLFNGRNVIVLDPIENNNRMFIHSETDTNSLLSSSVTTIKEISNGEFLITSTKGLSVIKNAYTKPIIENYYEPEGLYNNFIYGSARDDKGNFWLSTNYGLSVFDPKKNTFKTYLAEDGTYLNEFDDDSYYTSDDGELIFGGISGLIGVYPEKLAININPPKVILRSAKVNQKTDSSFYTPASVIHLAANQNSLHFDFSAPDFSNETKLFYYLKGGENTWIRIESSNALSLSNLAPGAYTLIVKSITTSGVSSEKIYTVSFVIHPPFWKSNLFLSVFIIFISLIIFFIYRFRLQRKIQFVKTMNRIRQEENEKIRAAAALDLHDEFGNGLTRISIVAELLKTKINLDQKELLQPLEIISENANRLYQGTRDFLWSITPGNDNLYEIVIRLKDYGDELFYGTGICFELAGLSDTLKTNHYPATAVRHVAMLFKEALTNILKHSTATVVYLNVSEEISYVTLVLKDNGKGFDINQVKKGYGIEHMKQRAAKLNSQLIIATQQNAGCEISITIYKLKNDEQ